MSIGLIDNQLTPIGMFAKFGVTINTRRVRAIAFTALERTIKTNNDILMERKKLKRELLDYCKGRAFWELHCANCPAYESQICCSSAAFYQMPIEKLRTEVDALINKKDYKFKKFYKTNTNYIRVTYVRTGELIGIFKNFKDIADTIGMSSNYVSTCVRNGKNPRNYEFEIITD